MRTRIEGKKIIRPRGWRRRLDRLAKEPDFERVKELGEQAERLEIFEAPPEAIRAARARADRAYYDLVRRVEQSDSPPSDAPRATPRTRARPRSRRARTRATDDEPHGPVLELRAEVDPSQARKIARALARTLVAQAIADMGLKRRTDS